MKFQHMYTARTDQIRVISISNSLAFLYISLGEVWGRGVDRGRQNNKDQNTDRGICFSDPQPHGVTIVSPVT
jgi:hypothetical protein